LITILKNIITQNKNVGYIIAQSLIGFIFLPILLNTIGLKLYGNLFLFISTSSFIQTFINSGYTNLITSFHSDWLTKKIYKLNVFRIITVMVIHLIFAIGTITILDIFFNIKNYFSILSIIVLPVYSFSFVITELCEVTFRMLDRYMFFVKRALIFSFLDFCLKVVYLISFDFELTSYIVVLAISRICFFLFLILNFTKFHKVYFNRSDRWFFLYSFNWMLSNLIGRFSAYMDKPIIDNVYGDISLAYYGLALRIGGAISVLKTALKNFWIYDALKLYPYHRKVTISRLLNPLLVAIIGMLPIAYIYLRFIEPEEFQLIFLYLTLFILSELIWVFYFHNSLAPAVFKNSRYLPQIQIIGIIIYFGFLILSITYLDIYGIIIAKIIQTISMGLLHIYYKNKIAIE